MAWFMDKDSGSFLWFLGAIICGVVCVTGCVSGSSQRSDTGATGLRFRAAVLAGVEHRYAVFVPRGYSGDTKAWPCVVFLNGSGECGTDGQRQLTQGLFPAMIDKPEDWPMIAVFPQKPDRASTWADHDAMVTAALDATTRELRVDEDRIYLTGLSQGGAGTWALAAMHPGVFAAIAPVCGFGDEASLAPGLASVPVWAFHGERDNVVPPAQTRSMIDAISSRRGRAPTLNPPSGRSLAPDDDGSLRITIFPDLNHGCWDRAYRDMELGEWMLSSTRHKAR